ncbi:MAG: TOBE domain-containing protein [Pseudomonadota bacterium]
MRGRNREGIAEGSDAMILVRPERMALKNGIPLDNMLEAELDRRDLEGAFVNLFLHAGSDELVVHLTNDGRVIDTDGPSTLGFMAHDALVLPAGELADD